MEKKTRRSREKSINLPSNVRPGQEVVVQFLKALGRGEVSKGNHGYVCVFEFFSFFLLFCSTSKLFVVATNYKLL